MQCTAKSKRSGEQCKRHATPGRSTCNIHGGKTPAGIASPHFKTGHRSKYLIARLQENYERNLADEKLLELADEIGVLRALVQEMMDKGGSYVQWTEAQKGYRSLRSLMLTPGADAAEVRRALDELGDVVAQGAKDWQNRREMMNAMEHIRKLTDSEHKHRTDDRMAITHEQLATQMAALAATIEKYVTDRETFVAITTELSRIVDEGPALTNGQPSAN